MNRDAPTPTTFPIRRQRALRPILLLFGVTGAESARVTIDGDRLEARFGFVRTSTSLADVERWDITGPYRWWRAVGVRKTLFKPELTFGGSAHGGVRVRMRLPLRIGPFRVRDLYLTMDDIEGFAAALAARGIPGADLRSTRLAR